MILLRPRFSKLDVDGRCSSGHLRGRSLELLFPNVISDDVTKGFIKGNLRFYFIVEFTTIFTGICKRQNFSINVNKNGK